MGRHRGQREEEDLGMSEGGTQEVGGSVQGELGEGRSRNCEVVESEIGNFGYCISLGRWQASSCHYGGV